MRRFPAWFGVALGGLVACQGDILGGSGPSSAVPGLDSGGSASAGSAGSAAEQPLPVGLSAGPRPLRRLTRTEYENTVRDLLKLGTSFASELPDDARGDSGFLQAGPVGEVDAERLQDAADRLAAAAVKGGLTTLMGCSPEGDGESSCVHQFLRSFGRRAFRRPLTDSELLDLESLFQTARTTHQLSTEDAVSLVLSAMLQAPQFLYLWERTIPDDPAAGALTALGPHELASRLAYQLWRSMPDQELFAAVDAGQLQTPEQITAQTRRLLSDPRSQDTLLELVRGWFHLPSRADDALSSSASGETALFVKHVLKQGGSLTTLLTSSTSFVNETLAPLYGASNVTGPELREMVVNPEQRFGLLTQLAFLGTNADGAQSHPVKRGAVIFDQLLCGELPPVPNDVPPPGPQQQGVPNRVRFAAHSQNACAVGCHRILDPLGFAFEHYDGTGRFRSMDGGQPVDASGSVELPSGTQLTFDGARQLVDQLVQSPEVHTCAAKQALRWALQRADQAADESSVQALGSAFATANFDLRELLVAAATSPSFLYRATVPAGALP